MSTYRQTELFVYIDNTAYSAENVRKFFDVSLPDGVVTRTYNVDAPGVEVWSDGKSSFPLISESLPYTDIFAAAASGAFADPEPEPDPEAEAEEARQAAIAAARAALAATGITITYGVSSEGEPESAQLWCRSEVDYYNYGVLATQIRMAMAEGLADRPYRISTMQGGRDFPDRATLRFVLARYLEAAQQLYESII